MTKPDYFARELVESVQAGEDVPLLELITKIRAVGFDFSSDREAFDHFLSEVEEFGEAFDEGDREAMRRESADVLWMLIEMGRRLGLDPDGAETEIKLKNAKRLAYIEDVLETRGKSWEDADYQTELKPLWDEAKDSGL